MRARYRLPLLVLVIGMSTGCDQATKQVAAENLKFAPPRSFLGDLFRLQYAENAGGFLSLGAGLPDETRWWLFMVGVGLLLGGVFTFALLSGRLGPLPLGGMALFLGGGLSNWVDRVMHDNQVVDFMNVGIGSLRTGVFNLADLFVMIGAAVLVGSSLLPGRRPRAATARHEPTTDPGEERGVAARERSEV